MLFPEIASEAFDIGDTMPRLNTHERCILRLPDAEIGEAREGDRYAPVRLSAF
ncbi:hypothetical protein ACFSQ7_50600 [Paenibacillus rhizoplanae]